jgi:hypothetical protein
LCKVEELEGTKLNNKEKKVCEIKLPQKIYDFKQYDLGKAREQKKMATSRRSYVGEG